MHLRMMALAEFRWVDRSRGATKFRYPRRLAGLPAEYAWNPHMSSVPNSFKCQNHECIHHQKSQERDDAR